MHSFTIRRCSVGFIWAMCVVAGASDPDPATPSAHAGDDRMQGAGTWRVAHVEVNGRTVDPEITSMLAVRYAADGGWVVLFKSIPMAEGVSTVDQSTQPKSFDMRTPGADDSPRGGRSYLGIYDGHADTRRLCFVPAGSPRPGEFRSTLAGGEILVELQRAHGGPDAITAPPAAGHRESSSAVAPTPAAGPRRHSTPPER